MRKLSIHLVNTVILVALLVFVGCTDVSSYQSYAIMKGIAHFSFEYRAYLRVKEVRSLDNMSYITLVGPLLTTTDMPIVQITAWVQTQDFNADIFLNNTLIYEPRIPDYRLLEQSDLIIDSVPAKQIAFTERSIVPVSNESGAVPMEVYRRVYFDHNGLVWEISIESISAAAEADKADFEHILQTFKFLP
jgi:hypothetical protein